MTSAWMAWDSTVVVLQQEIPAAANPAVARRARAAGARVVLNAAPARAWILRCSTSPA